MTPDASPGVASRKTTSRRSLLLAMGLAALLLFLALRGADWDKMLTTLRRGEPLALLAAAVLLAMAYFLRSLRWRVLLTAEKPISVATVFWAMVIGYLGNSFLPARLGELMRSTMIGRKTGVSTSFALATALTERILDAISLVLFSLIAIPFLDTDIPDWLKTAATVMAVLGVVGLTGFLVAHRFEKIIHAIIGRLPIPLRFQERLSQLVGEFLLGTRAFQHPQRALIFAIMTPIIWSVDTVMSITVAGAFGLTLHPAEALLLLAALGLASAAPSTPGYVGIFQFVAVTVLVPFGFTRDEALVYIISFQAITYFIVLTWGLTGLWWLNRGKNIKSIPPENYSGFQVE
ncbi:MAG: flippase-like domain-containing protein [Chloroflexi bacterium]|nr:flippase-like domain-containing protein [Chloroflexota bacterium]